MTERSPLTSPRSLEGRPRVLVVLDSDAFVRNYLQTGAFRALEAHVELTIIVRDGVDDGGAAEVEPAFVGRYSRDARVDRRHLAFYEILGWQHRNRSSSFRFRRKRTIGYDYLHVLRTRAPLATKLRALANLARDHILRPRTWVYVVLGKRPFVWVSLPLMRRRLPVSADLRAYVERIAPDLIVFPSSNYDPTGADLARIGRARGVPTIFLIDNWDNISSKTVLWVHPDYLGVWGPQQAEHAVRIHNFDRSRIELVGTPRLDAYFEQRNELSPSPFPFPYLLFAGGSLPFDELTALRLLDEELHAHPEIYGDARVVYRPHPRHQYSRVQTTRFDPRAFRHVVLDPQLAGYEEGFSRAHPWPELGYYGPLLQSSLIVLAPLTTMLLEALIFRKRVIVPCYDDGLHFTSPARVFREYEHFRGLEDAEGLAFCRNASDLGYMVRQSFRAPAPSTVAVDDVVGHFVFADDRPYRARLRDVVLRLLNRERSGESLVPDATVAEMQAL